LNVLVLEKHSLMRNLMKQVFHTFNVSSLQVTDDPEDAFEMALQTPPDLILSDWSHDLNGIDFLHRIRLSADSPDPFVPVIVVTAKSTLRNVYEARDAGMTEFLAKPVSAQTIYNRICATIEQNRAFVRSGDYFGPDRRRRKGLFTGNERRAAASAIRRSA
jgi:two-component system chemotaxis response regulator CheY